SKIGNFIGCRRIWNGARPLVCLTKAALPRKRATEKSGMNFPGGNNGRHRRMREIIRQLPDNDMARLCRWEVSNRTRSAFTISAGTCGNGARKAIKEAAARLVATGACCAEVHGRRAIGWRCNLRIETLSIGTSAT